MGSIFIICNGSHESEMLLHELLSLSYISMFEYIMYRNMTRNSSHYYCFILAFSKLSIFDEFGMCVKPIVKGDFKSSYHYEDIVTSHYGSDLCFDYGCSHIYPYICFHLCRNRILGNI